jgi:hypothetical protein
MKTLNHHLLLTTLTSLFRLLPLLYKFNVAILITGGLTLLI